MTYAETIAEYLKRTVAARATKPALGFIRNGELHWRTWRQVADDANQLAARIEAAGVEPGDCVAQVSENRYEWIITDLALHLAGAVHVPIHITLSGEQIATQITDCGAKLVFASTSDVSEKFPRHLNNRVSIWRHDEYKSAPSPRPPTPSLATRHSPLATSISNPP
jgi:long-subunit acyl-CoA synthetase (AMP-forming)